MNKESILSFFIICFYALGLIGGLGIALSEGYVLISLAIAALGVMAFPTFKKALDNLLN